MTGRRGIMLAAAVAALGVAGCGDDEPDADSERASARAQTTPAPARTATTGRRAPNGRTTTTQAAPATERQTVIGQPLGTLEPAIFTERREPVPGQLNLRLPRFFGPNSPWNTTVESVTVDPGSARMIELASQRVGVVEGEDTVRTELRRITQGVAINTRAWTVPVVTEAGGVRTLVWCRQVDCGPDAVGLTHLDIPPDVDPDPRYDGWYTVVNVREGVAYDLWRARRQRDRSMSFQYVRKWALAGRGFSDPYTVSARGSGLPLFAGLITREELESGTIDHALAISVPGPAQRRFVSPASATDGIGDVSSLPEGARIRLRADFRLARDVLDPRGRRGEDRRRIEERRRVADALVRALQLYGAIVVDRARVPTVYAQRDVSALYLNGDELASVKLDDFEVLSLGRKYVYPRPGTTQVGPGATGAERDR